MPPPVLAAAACLQVVKVRMLLDDTVRRITDVWQRGQLTAQSLPGLQRLAAAAGAAGGNGDLCCPTPLFPEVR
jgi:hypothetical protein